MKALNREQRAMASIAAYVAAAPASSLAAQLNAGLEAGLTINQIKEVLLQLYANCGLPRSLTAFGVLQTVLADRKARGNRDYEGKTASPLAKERNRAEQGEKIHDLLMNASHSISQETEDFFPPLYAVIREHIFSDLYERDVLTFEERELVSVAAFAAMDGAEMMLKIHTQIGRNVGLSKGQVDEVVTIGRLVADRQRAIFPLGKRGPSDWFTGEVYIEELVDPSQMEGLYSVGQVTFRPGGRTRWHTHPIGQTLLVVDGCGWYQERGKTARQLTKGSVVTIPKSVEHWHGASADAQLVHVAISNIAVGSAVTWLEPVSNAEYAQINQNE